MWVLVSRILGGGEKGDSFLLCRGGGGGGVGGLGWGVGGGGGGGSELVWLTTE